jgi:hypothetical protein
VNDLPARLGQGAEGREPLLPLPFAELMAVVKSSPALDAFARKRVGHMTVGHTPEADLTKPIGYIARQAKARLSALLDIVGPQRMNLPPGSRANCISFIDAAGAMLIALRERVETEVPE